MVFEIAYCGVCHSDIHQVRDEGGNAIYPMIGGMPETQGMLDYCAEHNIVSDIELTSIDKLAEAYDRVVKGDVRYRFVIDMATLPKS